MKRSAMMRCRPGTGPVCGGLGSAMHRFADNAVKLAHAAFFMLGAYFGFTLLQLKLDFWLAALVGGIGVGLLGIVMERFVLRRLAGNEQGQVLVTLGVSFIIADICLLVWTGDPMPLSAPQALRPPLRFAGFAFPTYRLVVLAIALAAALVPDLAYFVLFLPMVLVLVFLPQGLFGRVQI